MSILYFYSLDQSFNKLISSLTILNNKSGFERWWVSLFTFGKHSKNSFIWNCLRNFQFRLDGCHTEFLKSPYLLIIPLDQFRRKVLNRNTSFSSFSQSDSLLCTGRFCAYSYNRKGTSAGTYKVKSLLLNEMKSD